MILILRFLKKSKKEIFIYQLKQIFSSWKRQMLKKKQKRKGILKEMKKGYLRSVLISSSVSIFILLFFLGTFVILEKASTYIGEDTNSLGLGGEDSILEKADSLKDKVSNSSSVKLEYNGNVQNYDFEENIFRTSVLVSPGKSFITLSLDEELKKIKNIYYIELNQTKKIKKGENLVFRVGEFIYVGLVEGFRNDEIIIYLTNNKDYEEKIKRIKRENVLGKFVVYEKKYEEN